MYMASRSDSEREICDSQLDTRLARGWLLLESTSLLQRLPVLAQTKKLYWCKLWLDSRASIMRECKFADVVDDSTSHGTPACERNR